MSTIIDKATATANAILSYGAAVAAKKDALAKTSLIGQPNGIAKLVDGLLPLSETDATMSVPITGVVGDSGLTNYDIPLFLNGKPNGGDVLAQFVAVRKMVIPAYASGSVASCGVAPTNAFHIDVFINAFRAGSITFPSGSTIGVFSWSEKVVVPDGSLIKLVVREFAKDATISNIAISLRADAVASYPLATQAFKLVVSGYSAQLNGYPRSDFTYNGIRVGATVTSYDVVTLKPSDGTYVGRQSFNVYADPANADAMATYINSIPVGTPFLVFSADEPQTNHLTSSLLTAMLAKGATSLIYGGAMVHRAAYALLCMNDGVSASPEFYAGIAIDDPKSAFTLRWDWGVCKKFDTSSYGVIDNSAANLNLGSSDFTIEGWIVADQASLNNAYTPIIGQWNQLGASPDIGSWIFELVNGVPAFYWGPVSSSKWLSSSAGQLTPGERHHFAITRSGSSFTLWIDGISVATGTNSGATNTSDTTNMTIGDYYSDTGVLNAVGATRFTGILDSVKITKGVARYTTNFVPTRSLAMNAADPYWSNVLVAIDTSVTSGSMELTGKTLRWTGTQTAYKLTNLRCDTV